MSFVCGFLGIVLVTFGLVSWVSTVDVLWSGLWLNGVWFSGVVGLCYMVARLVCGLQWCGGLVVWGVFGCGGWATAWFLSGGLSCLVLLREFLGLGCELVAGLQGFVGLWWGSLILRFRWVCWR